MMRINVRVLYLLVMVALVLGACQGAGTPMPVVGTQVVTEVVEATPVEVIQVPTLTPEPEGPRTLVICTNNEPETLYLFGSEGTATSNTFEAIADGGWKAYDTNSFAYQPVLLEKLPSLADGDASLTTVTVQEGDKVVDAVGDVVVLDPDADPPQMLNSAGGGDPIPYQGGEVEMEQLSATFKLLPNLLWSNGESLTAADSVYAFNLLADPDTEYTKTIVEHTESYQAIDDQTTVWTGLPGFMDSNFSINFFGPAPEHVWGEYSAQELLTAEVSHLKPIGWGPYVIDEWVQGEYIALDKNQNYFRANEGLPKFDELIFRFIGDNTNTNLAALLSGECDILGRTALLTSPGQQLLDLQNSGQIKATFTTGTLWEHVDFSIQQVDYDDGYQMGVERPDFFSDLRTRQAFALCMDRQALVETLTFGQSSVVHGFLPPQHPLYNPDLMQYDFDPEAGSNLLEEVGWEDDDDDPTTPRIANSVANVPDGTPLAVTYETVNNRAEIVALLQESMAKCGIQINAQILPSEELFADGPEGTIFGRHFDLGEFAWFTGVRPPCDLYLSSEVPGPASESWVSIQDGKERTFGISGWGGQNDPGFVNEEYDTACNTALGTLPGQPGYEAAHLEAQRIFAEQLPVVPLFLRLKLAATRPDMCGFVVDPSNNSEFWNIEEFDYGEGCEG